MKGLRCYIFLTLTYLLSVGKAVGQDSLEVWRKVEELNARSTRYSADSTEYAIALAMEALKLARELGDPRQEALALLNLAEGNIYNDIYDQALEYNLNALDIADHLNDSILEANILNSLGSLYYDVSDGETSLRYYESALLKLRSSKDVARKSKAYNAVGLVNNLLGRLPLAQSNFEEAYRLALEIQDKERLAASAGNVGDVKIKLGQYDEALEWLNRGIRYSAEIGDVLKQAEAASNISRIYMHQGKFKEAESQLRNAQSLLETSKSNTRVEIMLYVALNFSKLYETMGEHGKALQNFKLYDSIKNQILSDSKKASLSHMALTILKQREEQKINRLEEERQLRITQRNAIAVGIILLSVLGFFVYSRERQIRIKEHQLAEAKQALTQAELEKISLEKEALNSKIEYKNSELTNLALHVSQRNDMLRTFLEELDTIKTKAPSEMMSQLSRTVKQFSNRQEINKEAEDFHINVESENKDFFFNLAQQFSDLTENEKRLCAQVRLNLSIKDIASINNISVKAVEMARYRLRKRFNMPHDESLADFLKKF